MSLSWSSASSGTEPRAGTGAEGGSPPISPASSARSSLSARDADNDEAPQPYAPAAANGNASAASSRKISRHQGAGSAAGGRSVSRAPLLLRSLTGPPDFLVGVWPPSPPRAEERVGGGREPARSAAVRAAQKRPGASGTAVAGSAATGPSKLWKSLAVVLGLAPDQPSGFVQTSWPADAGHVVPRPPSDVDLRWAEPPGRAGTARTSTARIPDATPSTAAAAAVAQSSGAAVTAVGSPDDGAGFVAHRRSASAPSGVALALQRAASAASSLWRDTKDAVPEATPSHESTGAPPCQRIAAELPDASTVPEAASVSPAATQSRCQCPQHRAKAAAAAAAAAGKVAAETATQAEGAPGLPEAAAAAEHQAVAAEGPPLTPQLSGVHLPLSYPAPSLARRHVRAQEDVNASQHHGIVVVRQRLRPLPRTPLATDVAKSCCPFVFTSHRNSQGMNISHHDDTGGCTGIAPSYFMHFCGCKHKLSTLLK